MNKLVCAVLLAASFAAHSASWSWSSSGNSCAVSSNGSTTSSSQTEHGQSSAICGFTGSEGSISLGDDKVELSDGVLKWNDKALPENYDSVEVQLRKSGDSVTLWIGSKEVAL